MIEVSNSDTARILACFDIAIAHYSALRGLRNANHAWAISQLKEKINRKLNKQISKPTNNDKK